MSDAPLNTANRRTVTKLALATCVMFSFGYALVPFYEKICQVYSDVRLGRGDLSIDASKYSAQKDRDAYKAGALNDVASLLQTSAGRSHSIRSMVASISTRPTEM